MNKTKRIKNLEKKIQQICPICQTIYQLLEIHYSLRENTELLKGKCLNNCLNKWKETLTDYHSKELMADLNNKENEEENDE